MVASRRDKLVSIQRADVVTDAFGEEVQTWRELGAEWAAIRFGRGEERRQAAQTQATQSVTFIVLDNGLTRGLTAKDRIVWNNAIWDLAGPGQPLTRGEIEITGTAAI